MSEESTKYFYDRIEAQRVEIEKLREEIKELEEILRQNGVETYKFK
jgi:hypothetical protein